MLLAIGRSRSFWHRELDLGSGPAQQEIIQALQDLFMALLPMLKIYAVPSGRMGSGCG